ncbi:hypothetical protein DAMA08_031020 [Martiniozyma asiatica (nom. inval.)]|nr:hypothetical protein DAMA08_031020 [Martiniozyma asiatica]
MDYILEIRSAPSTKYLLFTLRQPSGKLGRFYYFIASILLCILFHGFFTKLNLLGQLRQILIKSKIEVDNNYKFNLIILSYSLNVFLSIWVSNWCLTNMTHHLAESLLFLPSGIQTTTYNYYHTLFTLISGQEIKIIVERKFIPRENVKDLVILEGFYGSRVVYYMSIIWDGSATVCFPCMRPRRAVLEKVWSEGKKYLAKV